MISDCPEFTLIQHVGQKVNGTPSSNEIHNITSGDCYLTCFNMTGCYTFSYDASKQLCQLYTGCGTSCALMNDSAVTTYVRNCTGKIPKPIANALLKRR